MKYFGLLVFGLLILNCPAIPQQQSIPEVEESDTIYNKNMLDAVYLVVDEMPRFPGCEKEENIKTCADQKLLEYIYKNIRIGQSNENDDLEYKIVVSFIIGKDGDISDIELIRGRRTAEKTNIVELLEQMPKWIPGKLKGKIVKVKYNLPLGLHYE